LYTYPSMACTTKTNILQPTRRHLLENSTSELRKRLDLRGLSRRGLFTKEDLAHAIAVDEETYQYDGSTEFWSQGVPSAAERNCPRKCSLVDLNEWSVSRLRRLARDRSVSLNGAVEKKDIVDMVHRDAQRCVNEHSNYGVLKGWLGAHKNFRSYADYVVQNATTALQRQDGHAAYKALRGAAQLHNSVESHGAWEERTLFRFMKEEYPTSFGPFFQVLEREHEHLDSLIEEISNHLARWQQESIPTDLSRLERSLKLVKDYSAALHTHLGHEEQGVIPLVHVFTSSQKNAFELALGLKQPPQRQSQRSSRPSCCVPHCCT